jgi:hypothetical protein
MSLPILAATVAEAPGWAWYYSAGSDTYNANEASSTDRFYGANISVTSGTQITKISFKLETGASIDEKVALFDDCPNACVRFDVGCTMPSPLSAGWVDCTLSSPFSISSPVTVTVAVNPSGSGTKLYYSTSLGTYQYTAAGNPYSTFPLLNPNPDPGTGAYAMRVYAE